MFKVSLSILFWCSVVTTADAQALKPTVYYMGLPNVSQAAKDYHSGKMQAADNAVTYSIADSMSTENKDTRPFYIFLVSKMLMKADKKLLQHLGAMCREYIQNSPDPAVELLFSASVKPEYKYQWAKAMSYDMDITCETTLKKCFRLSRALALERCKEANKPQLEIIYNEMRRLLNLENH
ncbi:MAG: hypothetical protein JST82_11910 [Bacteroidetes bacterium]|nr:hypothetical protein [Bacteroidota bacterium]